MAVQLWEAMVSADRVVEQLRAASGPQAGQAPEGPGQAARQMAPGPPPPMPPNTPGAGLPPFPTPMGRLRPQPRRLPAASVPVVLLSLGALCLLVAAVVFVAVTWSLLGLTGRTLVLLGFTSLMAVIAVLLTRRSLRGAAETFWLVVAGMLTVDLLAAESAGLAGMDALTWRGTGALVGGALLVLGAGAGAWARRQPVTRLVGMELVAVIGGLVLCLTNAWFAQNPAIATTVAIPLLAGAFLLLRRAVPLAAYGLGALSLLSWVVLLAIGLARSAETDGLAEWWADGRGWPLVAAAILAAVLAHAPGVPDRVRPVAAGVALIPLVLLGNAPQSVGTPTRDLAVACATLVVLALLTAFAPRTWARGAAALTALGVVLLGTLLLLAPWVVLADLGPDGSASLTETVTRPDGGPAAWTAGLLALALVAALAALVTHVPEAGRSEGLHVVGALAPAALVLGGLVIVLQLEPPLWAGVLAAGIASAIAGGAAWWARDHLVAALLGSCATAYLTAVTLFTAFAADLLAAVASTATFLALAAVCFLRERTGALVSSAVAGALAALLGGLALTWWGQVMDADAEARALALAAYAGLVGVVAEPLTRRTSTRVSLEGAAALLAMVAVASVDGTAAAMALTVVGTAMAVVAVANRDRAPLGWAAVVVLGLATAIRVDVGESAPELYTLPAALLLTAVGAWRLRSDPATGSFATLGSGLTLGLVPSLLLALDEPVSLRGALVGAAGVLVLAAGVALRLAAPFVLGGLTTALLALRHLEPVADAVPRWISLGMVGLLLLLVGVTWEARRRNVETAHRYLTGLR